MPAAYAQVKGVIATGECLPLKGITPLEISGPCPVHVGVPRQPPARWLEHQHGARKNALLGPTEPMMLTIFCCIVHVG